MPLRVPLSLLIAAALATGALAQFKKPKTWIISDGNEMTIPDPVTKKHIGDPDDISAISGYLLMSNHFDTRAIVVGSTSNVALDYVQDQKKWADGFFLKAYRQDLPALNKHIGGYQDSIRFLESFRRASGKKYEAQKPYRTLDGCSTVQDLFNEIESGDDLINVLSWGTLTEAAILINHCLATDRRDILQKVRLISHWTSSYFRVGTLEHPEAVHNAFNDAPAAAYVKEMALSGHVKFYECSGIGQFGIVEGSPKGREYFEPFKASALGKIFVEGKFPKKLDTVDDSDCATYWALLGDWGVSLSDIASNGANYPEVEQRNEKAFFDWAPRIRDEMRRRAKAAATSE